MCGTCPWHVFAICANCFLFGLPATRKKVAGATPKHVMFRSTLTRHGEDDAYDNDKTEEDDDEEPMKERERERECEKERDRTNKLTKL